jgi:stringent starvation protein B
MTKVKIAEKGKKETINRYLIDEHVLIHIKPDITGVTIPEHLTKQPSVTLKISKFFQGNLAMLEEQIETELKFSGQYFKCVVPYQAIWGVTTIKGENVIWPKDVPPGAGLIDDVVEKPATKSPLKSVPMPAAALQMDYDPKDAPEMPPPSKKDDKPSKGSHLKRIK